MMDVLSFDASGSGPSVLQVPNTPFAVLCNNSKTQEPTENMPSNGKLFKVDKIKKIMLSTGEEFLVTEYCKT